MRDRYEYPSTGPRLLVQRKAKQSFSSLGTSLLISGHVFPEVADFLPINAFFRDYLKHFRSINEDKPGPQDEHFLDY